MMEQLYEWTGYSLMTHDIVSETEKRFTLNSTYRSYVNKSSCDHADYMGRIISRDPQIIRDAMRKQLEKKKIDVASLNSRIIEAERQLP